MTINIQKIKELSKVFILDTETTGLNTTNDRVVALAYQEVELLDNVLYKTENRFYSLYDPEKPISLKATTINHITNDMVKGSPSYTNIHKDLPKNIAYIIGQNIQFDIDMLRSNGQFDDYDDVKLIDTHELARSLYPDIETHSLVGLVYFLAPEYATRYAKDAHNALADVDMTFVVLNKMLNHYKIREIDKNITIDKLHEYVINITPTTLPFGKYRGEKIVEMISKDRSYMKFLVEQSDIGPKYKEIISELLESTKKKTSFEVEVSNTSNDDTSGGVSTLTNEE